jgi:hypothetical protein
LDTVFVHILGFNPNLSFKISSEADKNDNQLCSGYDEIYIGVSATPETSGNLHHVTSVNHFFIADGIYFDLLADRINFNLLVTFYFKFK